MSLTDWSFSWRWVLSSVRYDLKICIKLKESNFSNDQRRTMIVVCILLGISPASDCGLPTFRNPLSVPSSRAGCKVLHTLHPALEDGIDRVFRNVCIQQSDAGEIPKRIHRFKTRRKFYLFICFINFSVLTCFEERCFVVSCLTSLTLQWRLELSVVECGGISLGLRLMFWKNIMVSCLRTDRSMGTE